MAAKKNTRKPVEFPSRPILVWRWKCAPEDLKALSHRGGDQDWVAAVPEEHAGECIGWAEEGGPFGCCSVSRIEGKVKGYVILIGTHA